MLDEYLARKVLLLSALYGDCGGCGEKLIFYSKRCMVLAPVAAGGACAAAALCLRPVVRWWPGQSKAGSKRACLLPALWLTAAG